MTDAIEVRLYITSEAAAVLGVAKRLLLERIKSGEIRTLQWGNEKRIPAWELKRWQEAQLDAGVPTTDIDAEVERIMRGEKRPRFGRRKKVA